MAYLKNLETPCRYCKSKKATKELIDRFNGSAGKFCTSCAKTMLKRQLEMEKGLNQLLHPVSQALYSNGPYHKEMRARMIEEHGVEEGLREMAGV